MSAALTFPRIADVYGTTLYGDPTDVELRMLARYGLLLGTSQTAETRNEIDKINAVIRRLRELNPEIKIIDFSVTAPYHRTDIGPQPPEEAFLHTPEGKRIPGWPHHDMLNLTVPEAIDVKIETVAERIKGLHVDGVFVDCMTAHFDAWAMEIASHKSVEVDVDGDGKPEDPKELNQLWIGAFTDFGHLHRN